MTSHERQGVAIPQPLENLFGSMSRLTRKEISKLPIAGPLWWESTGEWCISLINGPVMWEAFPYYDVMLVAGVNINIFQPRTKFNKYAVCTNKFQEKSSNTLGMPSGKFKQKFEEKSCNFLMNMASIWREAFFFILLTLSFNCCCFP